MISSINYKVILLGNTGVGKSSIARKFVYNEFDEFSTSTIGSAYFRKEIEIGDMKINYDIWDTAGQEQYDGIIGLYYRHTDVSIIVYDITNKESFNKAKEYVDKVIDFNEDKLIIILVGNKTDLEDKREVEIDKALKYAKSIKSLYIETSAKNSHNIEELFDEVTKRLPIDNIKKYYLEQKVKRIPRKIKNSLNVLNNGNKNTKCCNIL